MSWADRYAADVAAAARAGACLAGHDWDGARYVTIRCTIDLGFGVAVGGPGAFIQHRRCVACGYRLTVQRHLSEPDSYAEIREARRMLALAARDRVTRLRTVDRLIGTARVR